MGVYLSSTYRIIYLSIYLPTNLSDSICLFTVSLSQMHRLGWRMAIVPRLQISKRANQHRTFGNRSAVPGIPVREVCAFRVRSEMLAFFKAKPAMYLFQKKRRWRIFKYSSNRLVTGEIIKTNHRWLKMSFFFSSKNQICGRSAEPTSESHLECCEVPLWPSQLLDLFLAEHVGTWDPGGEMILLGCYPRVVTRLPHLEGKRLYHD